MIINESGISPLGNCSLYCCFGTGSTGGKIGHVQFS